MFNNLQKKFILFGSGKIGKEALDYFGFDNVYCFVDNDPTLLGNEVWGKKVISFDELKQIYKKYILVISASLANAFEIKNQLESNHIFDYEIFEYIKQGRNYWQEQYNLVKQQMEHLIKQQRNNGINVEFYLVDAFEIAHFEPLYELFRVNGINAVFVAEDCFHNTSQNWFDYEQAIKILKERNLEYKYRYNEDAHIVFTTQDARILQKYKKSIKINMTYGCALYEDAYEFSKRAMQGFDYKFVHGKFMQEKCLERGILDKEHIKIVGFPKHYQLSGKLFDREKLLKELNIKTNKPIITYFPTWDENSSITIFEESIRELRKNFFIVTKAHHCTYRLKEKRKELDILYKISDIVLEGNYEFAKAAAIGDINLCDAKSGAALETCFINNKAKAVFLSVHDEGEAYFMNELFQIAHVVNQPHKLQSVIKTIMIKDEFQSDRIKKLDAYLDSSVNKKELWNILKNITNRVRGIDYE